jgi:deoxycytidylate deaminase
MSKAITSKDTNFYDLCHKIAATSECRYKMAAIIVQGSRTISVGINRIKTHPIMASNYSSHCISIHAELDALLRAQTNKKGSTLYVARYGGSVSKPCTSCMELIYLARVKYIVYSTMKGIVKERLYERI